MERSNLDLKLREYVYVLMEVEIEERGLLIVIFSCDQSDWMVYRIGR